jgi:hypothetical protein
MRSAKKSTTKQARPSKGASKQAVTKVKVSRQKQVMSEDVEKVQAATRVKPASIRQTIRQLLAEGKDTPQITAVLQQAFPHTAAAQKPGKHISYYRCQLHQEAAQ